MAGRRAIAGRDLLSEATRIAIPTWFVAYAAFQVWLRVAHPAANQTLFADARVYRLASLAWMQGLDPWGATELYPFAASPPTLVFMAPFALVPESVAIPAFVALSVGMVVFAVRTLRLPIYWVLWPPLVDAILVGNPDAMLVGLLLTTLAPLAVLAKVYAVIPVVSGGRWRALIVALILLALTAPFLDWNLYLSHWDELRTVQTGAAQNFSAWATPLLIPTAIALAIIGPRRAGWLVVPAVWPNTQFHYADIGLPAARHPILSLGLSVPVPLVAPASVIVFAVVQLVEASRRARGLGILKRIWLEDAAPPNPDG